MTDNFGRSFDRAVDIPKKTFASLEIAQQARDLIKQAAGQVVGAQLGRPSIARVISVDFVARKANVWFPGDQAPVPVNIFSSVLPGVWQSQYPDTENTSYAGYGAMAVIESFNGKQYITQILSGGQFAMDHQSAGRVDMAFDEDGNPTVPAAADYSFRVKWNTTEHTVQESVPYSFDSFDNRVLQGTWGTSESGQVYQVEQIPLDSSLVVEGGVGKWIVNTPSGTDARLIAVTLGDRADSFETWELIAPPVPTGASSNIWVNRVIRYQDINNYYYFETRFNSAGVAHVVIVKTVAGVSQAIGSGVDLPGTFVSGDRYKFEGQISDSSLKLRGWKSTDSRPLDWQIERTDTTFPLPGKQGVRSHIQSSVTNARPIVIQWDNIQSQSIPEITALPHYGDNFAINIGPFMTPDGGPPQNSVHEIDLLHDTGQGQMYRFTLNPLYQMLENDADGLPFDKWFRVIPDKINEDNNSLITGAVINNTPTFEDGVGEWSIDNADTTIGASLDLGEPTLKVQRTGAGAVAAATTPTGFGLFRVFLLSKYELSFDVYSPSAWAGGIQAQALFYDSPSDVTPVIRAGSTISINAATWTSYTFSFTSPSVVSDLTRMLIQINGSPPSGQAFYFRNVKYKNMGGRGKTQFWLELALRKTIHGATDVNLSNSPGELWLRIYIQHLNAIQNPVWNLRYRVTGGWTQVKSLRTGKPVYEYDIPADQTFGYLGYHDAGYGFTTNSSTFKTTQFAQSSGPWRNPDLLVHSRMQLVMYTSGKVTWNGSSLKWTDPFRFGRIGKSSNGLPDSQTEIPMPAVGTVIRQFPTGSSTTVDSNGIFLPIGNSLWIGIPPGYFAANHETLPNNWAGAGAWNSTGFFIIDELYDEYWQPPEWAILIASYAGSEAVRLGTGEVIRRWLSVTSFVNGWSGTLKVKRIAGGQAIHLKGTLTPGTKTDGTQVGTIPLSSYFPLDGDVVVPVSVSSGSVNAAGLSPQFYINPSGQIFCYGVSSATDVRVNAVYSLTS